MELSIVTTLYNSSEYIQEFYKRIVTCAEKISNNYEIVFVNDASPDDSLRKVLELYASNNNIQVVDLAINAGHHQALMSGLQYAKGDLIFLIDVDLEEPPELLATFWSEYHASKGIDMIYGVQDQRKGGWFEKISGKLFYKAFNFLSKVKIPENFLTVRLMSRRYVNQLLRFKESDLMFSLAVELTGFDRRAIPVCKGSRETTSYNFLKKTYIALNAIVSATTKPLWMAFFLGLTVATLSCIYIIKIIIFALMYSSIPKGWPALIVSVWFFSGLIIMFLGLIGLYLAKMFNEVKRRPVSILRQHYVSEKGNTNCD
ncbi:glycosyltransferase family 2 protein [Aquicella lusitana]|uniref:Putative glycosyltransferase n=1 Tax=Aquicella lusitana TaxID=254246 RepID=A0A370GWU9_9COXI|nr:glycosyltransferase family 2 protein [Aquicella lusitana]RDI48168.1 putative glycosyltransferase [Aquicella lusitana]VVC72816.1 Putative glycosyltransferases [Aquicella lusitana]